MRFSEQWLREWVSPELTTEALALQLTMAGLEVDSVTPAAPDFSGVVVGHVLSTAPHPNADRLRVCQVDIVQETVEVVCGASNVREGLKVAVILVGGVLPDGTRVKKAKLRGVTSHGMICSARELGLSDEHEGILELPGDAPVGESFRAYYQLDDAIIDVELTPNRGDCASVQGVAREIAATNNLKFSKIDFKSIDCKIKDTLLVKLSAKAACPRYMGRVIRHINRNAKTPLWMQEKLRRSGLRSIHPVVDVTNYVMLELGQPLHAFDQDQCQGGITVRLAESGESMTLLDGKVVRCDETMLVIADDEKPLALAGIMGAEKGSVTDETDHIFLESAFFAPRGIALTARRLSLQTDSSYRFERGVDFLEQAFAIERATQLLSEIVGGQAGPVVEVTSQEDLPKRDPIILRRDQISRVLGITLTDEKVLELLGLLGISSKNNKLGWECNPPSYRFDLALEVDLIEELARLHGYDHIPERSFSGALSVLAQSDTTVPPGRLMRYLIDRGYHEVITYSFVDEGSQQLLDPDRPAIPLLNPLASDMAVMRTSLWPGLLQALKYNQRRQHQRVRLFELGMCFTQQDDDCQQVFQLGGVVAGHVHPVQWGEAERPVDFYDVKADLDALLALTGCPQDFRWEKGQHPALHPGQTASLLLRGQCVGYLGALHPEQAKKLGVTTAYLFEMRLTALEAAGLPVYQPISRFPAVRRDLALIVDAALEVEAISEKIKLFSGHLLSTVEIFDIYYGDNIGFGKKSVALGLTFQDPSRTLVDDEINEIIQQVVSGLEKTLAAKLRA